MSETHIPRWTLADRLRKARIDAGLSQDELAEKARISRRTITSGECGAHVPAYNNIRAWAEVTHVPIEWILEAEADGGSSDVVTAEYHYAA